MTNETGDARLLLACAPDDYVAERARLAKEARTDKNRPLANFYQSLKRPTLALWAVLAAAENADAVRGVVDATEQLAEIQAAGQDRGALTAATKQRRAALQSLVDEAIAALARWETSAAARRQEVHGIVDQLSRHPELADSWIDGSLRDLPPEASGFGAFADMEFTVPSRSAPSPDDTSERHEDEPPAKASKGRTVDAANVTDDNSRAAKAEATQAAVAKAEAEAARQAEAKAAREAEAERVARAREVERLRKEVEVTEKSLHAAEQRLETALQAIKEAERELTLARDAHDLAQRAVDEAVGRT